MVTEVERLGGKVGSLTRWGHSPEDINAARRELAEAQLAEAIERIVSAAPPLTSAQLDRVTLILRGAR